MSDGPSWLREVLLLLPAYPHFVLSGNVRDHYFGPTVQRAEASTQPLEDVPATLTRAFGAVGLGPVVGYDISVGGYWRDTANLDADQLERVLGARPDTLAPADRLEGLQRLIEAVSASDHSVALIIESASRLVTSIGELDDQALRFFRAVDRSARHARPHIVGAARSYNPVVWLVDNERDLPTWFVVGNIAVRSVVLPVPDAGDRVQLAERRLPLLARQLGYDGPLDKAVRLLSEHTAGLPLAAIVRALDIAGSQGIGPDRVDDAARSYRFGVVENPWREDFVVERLRAELAPDALPDGRKKLRERVLGQPFAVDKVLDILTRSAAGLSAAQSGPSASRPRGVLFFAGPTGVGKTELAKALTKMLFDDDRAYIRFDMSEFSSEHAADRLIGAPPGYVGHDAGGELTNAMRARPFSVVLFDEIEKADPKILDKFLQVLDDGRLTDGRGDTVYFTEAVVVFTSNLGMYHDVTERVGGAETVRRVPAVTRETHPTRELREAAIKESIRQHFTLKLGRPELLNRIGEDNIVVFDFIDEPTALQILDGMVGNVFERVEREHGRSVALTTEATAALRAACLDPAVLGMGGRGIGSKLETTLVNPLARLLTLDPQPGATHLALTDTDGRWSASWA
jgi:ATP-dependent Clp protease ATP-binding subunit ClpB